MAKKRKDKSDRVILPDASRRLAPTVYLPSIPKSSLSDLRFYQPVRPKAVYDDVGRRSRVIQSPVVRPSVKKTKQPRISLSTRAARLQASFRERLSFADMGRALVCVRRKERREVLFAKRRTGRGSRSRKHRNFYSNIRC